MSSSLFRLFKPSHKAILEALVAGEKSLGELAEALQMSRPAASKHLKELVEAGAIKARKQKNKTGRMAIYELNRWTFIVNIDPALRRLMTFQTPERFNPCQLLLEQVEPGPFKEDLRRLIEGLDSVDREARPEFVVLFGSVARGEGRWKSDIDVALLRRQWPAASQELIETLISEVTVQTRHRIQPHFLKSGEVESSDTILCQEIRDSGIVIYGELFGGQALWQAMKRYRTISI